MMKILCLSREDIRKAIGMREAIQAVKEGFIQCSSGKAAVPLRTNLPLSAGDTLLVMPAWLPASGALSTKLLTVFPGNRARGLPTIQAVVILMDAKTGAPAALMEGSVLTALRTGAASGLATSLLARREAGTLAILGAGAQARTQMEAVCAVRDIRSLRIYDVSAAAAEAFRTQTAARGGPFPADIHVAASPGEAVRDADILCTATTAKSPVFRDADLKKGVHINAIGSYTPGIQEVPSETVLRARLFVDSRSAALEETGDLIIPIKEGSMDRSHILGELGELASGNVEGRISDGDLTLFKSVGLAVQDAAVAAAILLGAKKKDLGTEIRL
jgi:alanine dehydrogenase